MVREFAVGKVISSVVPISRFNRGEAGHIFDEVREEGCKLVVKNNAPACVLITPEKFNEMIELLEDLFLLNIAEERMSRDNGKRWTFDEVLAEDGLTTSDIDAMEDVEIE